MITSLEGLLEQHAAAALRISGADQTSWNGEIVEAGEGILGLAHWDGTLHLDRDCILDPLRDLYDRAGEPRPAADLIRYREALVTLLHEQSHFLGPTGATQDAARTAFNLPGARALEEGVAEAWSHAHLNAYLRDLEIDKAAPGILTVRTDPSYAAFVPAVRLLTTDLDHQAARPTGETLHLLNRQTAETQWHQVVTRIYHSSHLPHLVPPDETPAIHQHLEQALRTSFKGLELYEPLPRGFAASRSHAAATRMLTFLHQEIATMEHRHTPARRATRMQLTPATLPPPPGPLSASPSRLVDSPSAASLPVPDHASAGPGHQQLTPPTTPIPVRTPDATAPGSAHTPDATAHTPNTTSPAATLTSSPITAARTPTSTTPAPPRAPTATATAHTSNAIDSPHLAIHHAFAGLIPPTAHPPAPPNASPQSTPPTTPPTTTRHREP
ncbi:hypothetical protein AB0P21_32705 [Kribbella sp. NPDC056861]|uniref:hypothetical protein n=1 Tax=Kribbella sp. NPDC056861 TaxID=3154857 RepID=UPI00343F62BC